MTRFSIRLGLAALVLLMLLWWWWPSSGGNEDQLATQEASQGASRGLVSAIQPIDDADALIPSSVNPGANELSEIESEAARLQATTEQVSEFRRATLALQNGEQQKAATILQQLIKQQPGLLEPYINLASIQAAQGELESARETLMQGLNANKNFAALFGSLQKVHGALASNAYQMALATNAPTNSSANPPVALPIATQLTPSVAPINLEAQNASRLETKKLREQLDNQGKQLAQAKSQLAQSTSQLGELQEQLKLAQNNAQTNGEKFTNSANAISALEAKLSAAQNQLAQLQQSHESELNELRTELTKKENLLAGQQLAARENQQREEELAEQARSRAQALAAEKARAEELALAAAKQREEAQANDVKLRDQQAIARVKSWADAWSRQDVADYIAHYTQGYAPGNLSNSTWREQRRVRLTNKNFIEVTLSNFETQANNNGLQVRFTQRYRANTMDDTIRKQLTLVAPDGDWSQAKIINEQVLR